MTVLTIESCGPATSLQDNGRFGWQRYGVGPAGAMDRMGLAIANVLVGNGPGAAAIECALAGMRFTVSGGSTRIAIAGADADLKIDGTVAPKFTSVTADGGQKVEVTSARTGVFTYLAVAGGFAIPPMLGALSLHQRTGIGGYKGRTFRAGDVVPLNLSAPPGSDLAMTAALASESGPIRVVLGPQDDFFSADGLATFLGSGYTITPQADRMGLRLTGPKIAHGPRGYNIVSDGIATGAIQVPGMGEPLILLADRQTTGGYPKIATVITADLSRLAQMRPGAEVNFAAVSRTEAVAALKAQVAALEALRSGTRSAGMYDLDSGRLLSLNLLDGWVDARA
jgi:5-oxoprolinase (ATP-hydrolysing) subunit C